MDCWYYKEREEAFQKLTAEQSALLTNYQRSKEWMYSSEEELKTILQISAEQILNEELPFLLALSALPGISDDQERLNSLKEIRSQVYWKECGDELRKVVSSCAS